MNTLIVLITAGMAVATPGVAQVVETQPGVTETTTTTTTAGVVTTYEPNKEVVIQSDTGPVRFALGTAAHIIGSLAPGQHVKVYYTGPDRVVDRVEVVD